MPGLEMPGLEMPGLEIGANLGWRADYAGAATSPALQ
jgi:hypothetical protein